MVSSPTLFIGTQILFDEEPGFKWSGEHANAFLRCPLDSRRAHGCRPQWWMRLLEGFGKNIQFIEIIELSMMAEGSTACLAKNL